MAIVQDYAVKKAPEMAQIGNLCLTLVKRSLEEKVKSLEPVTLQEAKLVADIFTALDKIIKLDSGQATEIIDGDVKISLEDVREALIKDKFIDVTPTEVLNATTRKRKPERKLPEGETREEE